jgi:hypothetical protein
MQSSQPSGETSAPEESTPPPAVEHASSAAGAFLVAALAVALMVAVGSSLFRPKVGAAAKDAAHLLEVTQSLRLYGPVMKWLGTTVGVLAIVEAVWLGGRLGVIAAVVGLLFALAMHATGMIITGLAARLAMPAAIRPTTSAKGANDAPETVPGPATTVALKRADGGATVFSDTKPPAAPTKSGVDPLPLPSGPSSTAEPKPSWEHPKVTAGLAPLAEAKKNGNDVIRATSDGASLVPASNGGGGPAVRAGSNLASAATSQKSDDALRLAITLAIDAKEYQRAAELLAVVQHPATKPASSAAPD